MLQLQQKRPLCKKVPIKKCQKSQCVNEASDDKNGKDSGSKGNVKSNVAASVETSAWIEEVHSAWIANGGNAAYSTDTFDSGTMIHLTPDYSCLSNINTIEPILVRTVSGQVVYA